MSVRSSLSAVGLAFFLVAGTAQSAVPADVGSIVNFREYSDLFSSAGQPTAAQLEALSEDGFERVIFLAFSDHEGSIVDEDRVVRNLGMDYVHIPVVWESPTRRDFYTFAAVMQQAPDRKTLLHCQVNFRASAFSFLYRVIYAGVSLDDAKDDLDSVWVPNTTWRDLIFEILEENGVSPHCEACEWSLAEGN